MALTRPVVGADISATDFGQPVYDWITAATPTAWTALTLVNGWTNAANEQACQIRAIGDMTYIRGRAGGGTTGTAIFNCPANLRPPRGMAMSASYNSNVPAAGWYWCLNDFRSDGNYVYAGPSGGLFVIIDGYWSRTA